MNNKTKKLLLYALAWVAVTAMMPSMPFGFQSQVLSAQTAATRTTLSSAMVSAASCTTNCTAVVSSATGMSASTASLQSYIMVDAEIMQVRAINSTTLTVLRARQGFAPAHASGATVIFGYGGTFNPATGNISTVVGSPTVGASVTGATFVSNTPTGSCTRSQNGILPVFGPTSQPNSGGPSVGFAADCLGGVWVVGTMPDIPPATPLVLACNVPIGSVAYTSMGTDTQTVAGTNYRTSLMVPKTGFITGVKILNGTTAVTDSMQAVLEDSAGNVIYQSTTATVSSGANIFQNIPLSAAAFVVGPARYFVRYQSNGANARVRLVAASTFVDVVTTSTVGTFGTITNPLTVPTTFNANVGPIVCLYY